jgi:hypothetical protein
VSRLGTEVRVVWIDALCINQKDDLEKAQQVQLMRQIYSLAQNVVIWLGKNDTHVPLALELMGTCLQAGAQDLPPAKDTDKSKTYFTPGGKVDLSGFPPPHSDQWGSLITFYESSWFSRVWIIQESILASTATIYIGNYEISWEAIGKIAIWAGGALYNTEFDSVRLFGKNAAFVFSYARRQGSRLYPLADLLNFTRGFDATQPVDQIYALLGIVDDKGVVVDYSLPLDHVFTQVARHLLYRQPDLEVLSMVHHAKSAGYESEGFPSWVPKWHQRDEYPGIIFNQTPKSDAYATATAVPTQVQDTNSRNTASLKGLLFDAVDRVGPIIDDFDIGPDYVEDNDIVRSSHIVQNLLVQDARYPTGEAGRHTVLKTLTAGLNVEFEPAESDPEYTPAAESFFNIFFEQSMKSKAQKRSALWQKIRRSKDEGLISQFEENDSLKSYYDAVVNACSRHRLFVTTNGYIGLGPLTMQDLDTVAILFGGKVPLVLRRAHNQWKLVGECYLHGVMKGEAAEAWRRGDLESQWFEIS